MNQTLTAFNETADTTEPSPDAGEGRSASRNASDQYGTPVWLIDRFQQYLPGGLFDLDAAAGAEATEIARWRLTIEDDALAPDTDWLQPKTATRGDVDSILLNPPFSDPEPFLRRLVSAVDPADPEKADFAISITRADTTTDWFHDHLSKATALWFYDGRFEFHSPDASGDAGFACAVGLFGTPPEGLLQDLAEDGQFYTRDEVDDLTDQQGLNEFGVAPDTPFVRMDDYDNPLDEARRRFDQYTE